MTASTLPLALAAILAADPARPLVTWLGPDGARTELSARTFDNTVAKAANLLQDEADVDPGSRVTVSLPPHWQSAVWLAACAATGTVAWLGGDPSDDRVRLALVGPTDMSSPTAPLTLAVSLHPLGMPLATTPTPGVLDAAVEVRAQGDRFAAYTPPTAQSPWLVCGDWEWTHGEALTAARELADGYALAPGARVLVSTTSPVIDQRFAAAVVALPLAIRGSVVLVTDPTQDLEGVAVQERCDAALGLD